MLRINQPLWLLVVAVIAVSCNQRSDQNYTRGGMPNQTVEAPPPPTEEGAYAEADAKDKADAIAASPAASLFASEPAAPKERKFVRTAELQYRTQNVQKTTETIENWTRQYGGFVLQSSLSTSVDNVNTAPAHGDSLLENTVYTIHNTMVLRVPNQFFDTMLVRINGTMDFLELRRVSADDVSLTMLANKLRSVNSRQAADRMRNAINRTNKKLSEMTEAERTALNIQNDADAAAMQNLNLQDRVDFCTIEARIYQRPIAQQRIIPNVQKYIDYTPPFFSRVWESLSNGWFVIVEVFLGVLQVWFLLPFIALIAYFIKKWRKS